MLPVKYVPRLEFDEVKTALEIAEDEYRRAAAEAARLNKICQDAYSVSSNRNRYACR